MFSDFQKGTRKIKTEINFGYGFVAPELLTLRSYDLFRRD